MSSDPVFTVRNPSGVYLIIIMAIFAGYNLNGLLFNETLNNESHNIKVGIIAMCSVVIIVSFIRTFLSKSREITFTRQSFVIGGKEIKADDISTIMITYGTKPNIGIRPNRKLIVPMSLAFRFEKDQDSGLRQLEQWAKDNSIEITRGQFMKWI
ncbi:hypothetical protein [Paenibacillus sp. KN14-4R]|uniref:hypothetical protein n=1 Tax=Paenibacillus sp. KN14-4R TaxID=3445773 RepID=UPI003FA1498F